MPTFDELMFNISQEDYEPTSTHSDLHEFLQGIRVVDRDDNETTSWAVYAKYLADGQRAGQAFMNSLPASMYDKLTSKPIDPFYKSDSGSVLKALDYLILS
jgi:hypothetical protein